MSSYDRMVILLTPTFRTMRTNPSNEAAKLTFVDLYCGAGFGASGAVKGGGVPLLAVDSWDLAAETYQQNFPFADVVCAPVESLDPSMMASRYKPDVLLTSPECTSHSIARGSKPGCERSRETMINVLPWIDAMDSRWVIVENVRRVRQWHRHEEFIREFESRGYTVSELFLNAADFGVPQSRKRMFLIGDREGTKVSNDHVRERCRRKTRTARSIIDWSSRYKSRPLYSPRRAKATIERAERGISVLGKGVDFIIVYYGSDYAGGWQHLDSPLRTVTTLDRFGLITWESGEPMLRMLQPRELIKAMGAPTTHKVNQGTRRDKIRLCGNGVCSPVMELLFKLLSQRHFTKAVPAQ